MEWNARLPGGALPPELLNYLISRGLDSFEAVAGFLSPEHYHPAPPTDVPDIVAAAARINQAIDDGERFLIWGDFDVDGQTSTAMFVESLRLLGAAEVSFHIPDRIEDSHGVQLPTLQRIISEREPDIMIVCDTGSAETEALTYAHSIRLPVIISDHHEIAEPPPPVDMLVNPLRLPEGHPLRTLSGAGITYLLLLVVFQQRDRARDSERLLDLLALGLVADVVGLIDDTRYLLQIAMRALRRTNRPGIIELCKLHYINPEKMSAEDIGFRLAPALNAFGRLATAAKGVELLTTRSTTQAVVLAGEAVSLNKKRKNLTEQMTTSAIEMVENDPSLLDWEALVLSSPNWNSGIVGIVAARLVERFEKPAVLLVEDSAGNARGSIRSVPGYHVSNALENASDILDNYGGHELAGGLAVSAENLPLLRRRLSQAFAEATVDVQEEVLSVAADLSLERLTLDFAYQIQRLGPFGQGNRAPYFRTRDVAIASTAYVGKQNKHRRLTVEDHTGIRRRVFWWSSGDRPTLEGRFDIIYDVSVSYFKDAADVQLTLQDWQQVAAPEPDARDIMITIDRRNQKLGDILAELPDDVVIWAEGMRQDKSPGKPRSALVPAEVLVIYTVPPSARVTEQVLNAVKPKEVHLMAVMPPIMDIGTLLHTMNGLAQTVLNKMKGEASLQLFAERLAVTTHIVHLGLQYLATEGLYTVKIGERGKVWLDTSQGRAKPDRGLQAKIQNQLNTAWTEMSAYRRYMQNYNIEEKHGSLSNS